MPQLHLYRGPYVSVYVILHLLNELNIFMQRTLASWITLDADGFILWYASMRNKKNIIKSKTKNTKS